MFRFVSFRGRAQVLLAAAGLFLLTQPADAELLPGYATGEGANTSSLVIDFGYLGEEAFVFEYSYDGSATGEDMLLALNEAGPLTVGYQVFHFEGQRSIFVDGFDYQNINAFPSFVGENEENWSYWVADAPGQAYTGFDFGPSGRNLQDGSVDGWAINVASFNSDQFPATNNPPAIVPVPEPSSAVLPGLAGAVLIRRRRSA